MSELYDIAKSHAAMRQIARKEALRISIGRVIVAMSKAAVKALPDAFHNDFEFANDDLETTSSYFVVGILTKMAQKSSLCKVLDRNIEHWTQKLTFLNAFVRRALTSSRLVRPMAKLVRKKIDMRSDVIGKENRPPIFSFPVLETPRLSS